MARAGEVVIGAMSSDEEDEEDGKPMDVAVRHPSCP